MTDCNDHIDEKRIGVYCLIKIFIRSLSIQSSWNFSKMQNIAFAFSLIPFIRKSMRTKERTAAILQRHLELFSTHPYMSGPIIGSVVKLEEESIEKKDSQEAVHLKKALMAPYAAMGDPLFWGALRPASAIVGVMMAIEGLLVAPLIFLLLFNPLHLWVRLGGFVEGYRGGKGAVNLLKSLNPPETARKIRWVSTVLLGILAGAILAIPPVPGVLYAGILGKFLIFILILLCYWLVKRGISPLVILYSMSILFLIMAV
ncbi:MAG: PTS system mannose/fructose/sorbose family transporter subunit IID [Deltaproteobacteria bacterium]|nr:PTS system mannose/fructose/sorbose family transporter subunit IID [Deltaproteobacteria bacterium]